jgi:hypothetical protein
LQAIWNRGFLDVGDSLKKKQKMTDEQPDWEDMYKILETTAPNTTKYQSKAIQEINRQ